MQTSRFSSRFFVSAAVLACAAGALAPASAQEKMRPGLWEHSVTMKSQSGQMEAALAEAQKAMANMAPARRKQMEQMMAAQGIHLSSGPQGQTSVKVCITPEQAAIDQIPQQDGCTQKVQRTDASTMQVSFSCKGESGEGPTSGEGTVHFQGPTGYSGNFKINTQQNGKPEQIDMAQTGRWLSNDCGAIKPAPTGR